MCFDMQMMNALLFPQWIIHLCMGVHGCIQVKLKNNNDCYNYMYTVIIITRRR